jgi:hypothetical protein
MDDARYLDLKASIERGFSRMDARFDDLDGRQRESENMIAVLQDRSNREKSTAAQFGGVAGGFFGGLLGVLSSILGGK